MKRLIVVGGDRRFIYLTQLLRSKGYAAERCYQECGSDDFTDKLSTAQAVILPLPITRDGVWLNTPLSAEPLELIELFSLLGNRQVFGGCVGRLTDRVSFDYSSDERFCAQNALLTAEGAIAALINNSESSICHSKLLVYGYGRIATALCDYARAMHSQVTVAARSVRALCLAELRGLEVTPISQISSLEGYDYIVNTIPARVIDNRLLDTVQQGSLLIELASKPGGYESGYSKKAGINAVNAQALPAACSPYYAAKIIMQTIENQL